MGNSPEGSEVDKKAQEFNELKEDIKGCKLSIGSLNSNLGNWVLKWGMTQEVLQELFQAVINAINKNTGIGLLASELEDILKKLDKTEKKECKKKVYCQQCNEFINNLRQGEKAYCKKGFNCYEHAKTLRKASGGEKPKTELQCPHCQTKISLDTEFDCPNCESEITLREMEEPPKPKCPFCGRNLIWFEQAWICGHGCTKPAIKATEPEKDRKYPKVVYQLGSDSKEYIALKKKYDKLIEDRLNDWYELDNELTLEGKVRVQREKIEKWQDAKEMTEENEG